MFPARSSGMVVFLTASEERMSISCLSSAGMPACFARLLMKSPIVCHRAVSVENKCRPLITFRLLNCLSVMYL